MEFSLVCNVQICTDFTYNNNNKKFYTALSGSNTRDNHRNACLQKKQTLPMIETRAELEFFRAQIEACVLSLFSPYKISPCQLGILLAFSVCMTSSEPNNEESSTYLVS